MTIKVIKEHELTNIKVNDSIKRWTLNYTDIVSNSNKMYNLELVNTNQGYFLYTSYGRTGGTVSKEYRACNDQSEAEKEAEKIIKSKIKKGYVEVKLVKADVGSEIGKSKVEASAVSEEQAKKLGFTIIEDNKSKLEEPVQNLVKTWFGSIEQFIINNLDTSKCALGQLSIDQINKGRDILLEIRNFIKTKKSDINYLNKISSNFYGVIPQNFGYSRLNPDQLRFDSDIKLDLAFDMLDTFENAKDVEKVLNKKNVVDEQYATLNTDISWINPEEPMWKWIDLMFHKTRASNHSFLGKMKINNIFKLGREKEYKNFLNTIESFAATNNHKREETPSLLSLIYKHRVKEHKDYEDLLEKANVLTLFHGSKTENFSKIVSSHLKFRKPGFTVSGSMYDKEGGLYFGFSSKACNYSSAAGSYWANGSDNKGYLFVSDVALGKQKIAKGAYPYSSDNINPCKSVWAKGGYSGVINDEFIVYTHDQNWLRYVIEFETQI